jgi:ABC-type molybdate transport system substrate-binding protein
MLVNQVIAGSLDAAVVYRSNVLAHRKNRARLDVVEPRVEGAVAFQSYAIGKASDHRWLLSRLFQRVCGEEARARFESVGFRWNVR